MHKLEVRQGNGHYLTDNQQKQLVEGMKCWCGGRFRERLKVDLERMKEERVLVCERDRG